MTWLEKYHSFRDTSLKETYGCRWWNFRCCLPAGNAEDFNASPERLTEASHAQSWAPGSRLPWAWASHSAIFSNPQSSFDIPCHQNWRSYPWLHSFHPDLVFIRLIPRCTAKAQALLWHAISILNLVSRSKLILCTSCRYASLQHHLHHHQLLCQQHCHLLQIIWRCIFSQNTSGDYGQWIKRDWSKPQARKSLWQCFNICNSWMNPRHTYSVDSFVT